MAVDWLPGKRSDQLIMANEWIRLFRLNGTKWIIPNDVETELETLTEIAQEALNNANNAVKAPVFTANSAHYA